MNIRVSAWLTVEEAIRLPLPDTSWMNDPIARDEFISWTMGRGPGIGGKVCGHDSQLRPISSRYECVQIMGGNRWILIGKLLFGRHHDSANATVLQNLKLSVVVRGDKEIFFALR